MRPRPMFSLLLGILAALLLAIAVVQQFRRPSVRRKPAAADLVAGSLIALLSVVGIVVAVVTGAALQLPVPTLIGLGLLAVLMRRNRRFWISLALVATAYLGVGLLVVTALSHNYLLGAGEWRGVRLLVAWAGPEANPTAPRAPLVHWYLAIARYALPMGAAVAVAWQVTARRRLDRMPRLAMLAIGVTLLVDLLPGALRATATVMAGVMAGLPAEVALPAVAGSLLVLVGLGPVALIGLTSGAATLLRPAELPGNTAASAPSTAEEPPDRLLPLLTGSRPGLRRVQITAIALVVVLIGPLAHSRPDRSEPVEIAFEYVDPEMALPARVERALQNRDGSIWLLTADDQLRRFDPGTRTWSVLPIPVSDAVALGEGIVLTTAEPMPRLLRLTGIDTTVDLRWLTPGRTAQLAVLSLTVPELIVAQDDGRVLRLTGDGDVLADFRVEPIAQVVTDHEELFTLHDGREDEATGVTTYRAVHRNDTDGAALGTVDVREDNQVFDWAQGRSYQAPLREWRHRRSTDGLPWSIGDRSSGSGAHRTPTHYFSYDQVLEAFETTFGTWVVVEDVSGLRLTPRAQPAAYLVRWPGAPVRTG